MGLEALTALKTLDLSFNQLDRFEVPSELTELETLRLGGNGLTELELPVGLNQLRELALGANRLNSGSIAGLAQVPTLERLDLGVNELTEVWLPDALQQLSSLFLGGNKLVDVTFGEGLTQLERVGLDDNLITKVTLPSKVGNLGTLTIERNRLTSLDAIEGLERATGLYRLEISENQLEEAHLPVELGRLSQLGLRGNPLTSLELNYGPGHPLWSGWISMPASLIGRVRPGFQDLFERGVFFQLDHHYLFDVERLESGGVRLEIAYGEGAVEIYRSSDLRVWERIAWVDFKEECHWRLRRFGTYVDTTAVDLPNAFYRLVNTPDKPPASVQDSCWPSGP